ncbi:hypothetical protein SLS58_006691 [Diplodia intermedia]|uniref:FAD-dependent oxidoreductase 2 FAD-binding domain-containing protein n=1 Tax=Diplodia intermedia TaxID=856260 RepID=A0ABR3TME7_9PEZI
MPGRRTFLLVLALTFAIPLIPMLYTRLLSTMSQNTTTAAAPSARRAIVVGSGLAGLSAASTLLSAHHPVTLLERLPKPGGNSIKASSGINGAPTRYQPAPEDDTFYADTVRSAGAAFADDQSPLRDALIRTLTQRSRDAIYWLADGKGIDLSVVAQLGGHTRARTHRGAGPTPPGAAIVTALLKELNASPLFTLLTNATVTRLLPRDGNGGGGGVAGVEYHSSDGKTHELRGPVVFATGGFAGDAAGLLQTYRPDLAGLPSTNEAWPGSAPLLTAPAVGGARLVDMDMVQVHPTGFVDPEAVGAPVKFLAAEVLRGEGGVMLRGGKRFVDELQTRQVVTDRITEVAPDEVVDGVRVWDVKIVLDEGAYQAAKSHVGFYLFKGLMRKTTVAELGGEQAVKEVQAYADAAAGKAGDPLGRKAFGHWELRDVTPESVVYVGRVTPVVHFTMGGVVINDKAEVLDKDDKPIEGVWAAGEAAESLRKE